MNLESVTNINHSNSVSKPDSPWENEVMNLESATAIKEKKSATKANKDIQAIVRIVLLLLALSIICSFFAIVNPGQRGVLMRFGEVQPEILSEGIHPVIPIVNTVEQLSIRVQNQEISTEASSRDLQNIYTDVALNWHIVPEKVNIIFQRVGNQEAIVHRIINPAVKEVLKAVMARYTAEEIITARTDVKAEVDRALRSRLASYDMEVDDISLVNIHFSDQFNKAVEAKQIAEQEAKRAGFLAIKAAKQAKAKVNLAVGEAKAHQLIMESLTPAILQRQAIAKWDGRMPWISAGGGDNTRLFQLELDEIVKAAQTNPDQQRVESRSELTAALLHEK
ncbi:prohibitin family protein [Anabaena azotica]|uniref:Prohibitin family protein n=1 Tax=Anabaena azotica FACHB-119 TaxID=947527 RepID=A0ABR8CYA0_9NOST|nr:prohibitin family protein [Anabaena azotica]MBD2499489.1 prohibitin family protein [Anabaena azotica FACHB-119]